MVVGVLVVSVLIAGPSRAADRCRSDCGTYQENYQFSYFAGPCDTCKGNCTYCYTMGGPWMCPGPTYYYVLWAQDQWTRTYVGCVPPEQMDCPNPLEFESKWVTHTDRHEYDCPASACCEGEGKPVCKPPDSPHKISDVESWTYAAACVCD
jgi:hypothetical protein